MVDTPTLSAIDFLPDNLQDGNELYPWVAGLIDHALPPSTDVEDFPIDDLLSRLGVQYDSEEGVSAYFNKFIKTIIGTRPAMQFAFQLIGTEARIVEWFENEVPAPAFKFIIEFDSYPGLLDFNALIDLIFVLKNERSWPTVIRMAECAENLILDYGHLDNEHLSASEGYMTEMGIMLCLFQRFNGEQIQPSAEVKSLFTGIYTTWYEHQLALRWDYDQYDQPWNEAWSNITTSRGTITSAQVRHDFASEYCAVPDDLIEHGYCLASYVTIKPYHTATYESQIVPSDYGTLSGGEGFIGAWVDLETDFELDHDDHRLSDIRILVTPLTIFEWIKRDAEELHFADGFLPILPTRQTIVEHTAYLDLWTRPEETLDHPETLDNPHVGFISPATTVGFDQQITKVHAELTSNDWSLYQGTWGDWTWASDINQPVARRFNWHVSDQHLFNLYLNLEQDAYLADPVLSPFHTVVSDQYLHDLYLSVAADTTRPTPELSTLYWTLDSQQISDVYPTVDPNQPTVGNFVFEVFFNFKDHLYLGLEACDYRLDPLTPAHTTTITEQQVADLYRPVHTGPNTPDPEVSAFRADWSEQQILDLYPVGPLDRQPRMASLFYGLSSQTKDHLYLDLAGTAYLLEPVRGGFATALWDTLLQDLYLSVDRTTQLPDPPRSWSATGLRSGLVQATYPERTWLNNGFWGDYSWEDSHPQPVMYSTHTTEDA